VLGDIGSWVVADEELLAASVTPEYSHLLEAHRFLAATLFYCYRTHVLILDCWQFFWQLALQETEHLNPVGQFSLRAILIATVTAPLIGCETLSGVSQQRPTGSTNETSFPPPPEESYPH
jgi:hypothetical protein